MKPPAVSFVLLLALPAFAEEPPAQEAPGIQDNSFLMEEAYNQERGVVQHISAFTRSFDSHDWTYTFTQEWPLHRLSISSPAPCPSSGRTAPGWATSRSTTAISSPATARRSWPARRG